MVKLEHIVKIFNQGTVDETTLFDNFSFHVSPGEFVSVIGSNGSGKTTLLNLICGSLSPDAGKIFYGDRDITSMKEYARAKYIGRVFQNPSVGTCAGLTILENMALADNKNRPYGLGRAVNRKRQSYYRELLSRCNMGLENRMEVPVGNLSGGQRQALALIIANMTDISLLILDEHTAALDPKSSEIIMELTDKLVKERQITTLMVTHNLRFAVEYGSRLVMMDGGEAILDIRGKEKEQCDINQLVKIFNDISIEKGN